MTAAEPGLSIVIPLYNESENVAPLCDQLSAALHGQSFEVILVDDGSSDTTAQQIDQAMARFEWLRPIFHVSNAGQSAAILSGVRAAHSEIIATSDGDLQNDPTDILRLVDVYNDHAPAPVLVAGIRVDRHDSALKRVSSKVANAFRRAVLNDNCVDTGCGLKVFSRALFLSLPSFDHMHRFLPALFAGAGAGVISVPVNHRPRTAGVSKYGVGNRLWVGLVDVMGVKWLQKRAIRARLKEKNRE